MNNLFQILPNVKIGQNYVIEPYAIVGLVPPNAKKVMETEIGDCALIRSHTVIYAGNHIGSHFQTGHNVLIREKNQIGDHVSIGTSTVIEHHVVIGNKVRIHSQAFVPEFTILEDGCWIGPNVVFTNARYPNRDDTKANLQGVKVSRNAVIGANVTILPNIIIGHDAIIGAGSVVTKNVPPRTICFGNPAKVYRDI